MGDAYFNPEKLAEEDYRRKTFGNEPFKIATTDLAHWGFYYTRKGHEVECYSCHFKIDAQLEVDNVDIFEEHKTKKPNCNFVLQRMQSFPRKTFVTLESLRYEEERRSTFINWPILYISPKELAQDGFYYLRDRDHCACVFCRGIIGAWEEGDTPRAEHKRHFPHCPFIRGQPVGNVPLSLGQILSNLHGESRVGDSSRHHLLNCRGDEDVCGPGTATNKPKTTVVLNSGGSSPQHEELNLESIGLTEYSGPKRKDFITLESRISTYDRWPSELQQNPQDLAEAGFFYCGLSDHVRCFHCGNGLRNWVKDDLPWQEHARWYPECNFILLTKGKEFIDKVCKKPSVVNHSSISSKPSTSQVTVKEPSFKGIKEQELDKLMELDVIKAVLEMSFSRRIVRSTLKQKIEQTGQPFFSLEPCIEAAIQFMEDEAREAVNEMDDEPTVTSSVQTKERTVTNRLQTEEPLVTSVVQTNEEPSLANAQTNVIDEEPPVSSNLQTIENTLPRTGDVVDEESNENLTSEIPVTGSNPPDNSASEGVETSEEIEVEMGAPQNYIALNNNALEEQMEVLQRADEVINEAEKVLNSEISSGAVTSETTEQQSSVMESDTSKDLRQEIKRLKEISMCKVCMDAEADVLFLPCTHILACSSCAVNFTNCPICREDIKYAFKTIRS